MGTDNPFFKQIRDLVRKGEVPYVEVNTTPVTIPQKWKGKGVVVNPKAPYSHYRSRLMGGRRAPRCAVRGCYNQLKRNDLLCCSPECTEHLRATTQRILDILNEKPTMVYVDFLDRGIGGMTTRGPRDGTRNEAGDGGSDRKQSGTERE
jgi:hypothetical protein